MTEVTRLQRCHDLCNRVHGRGPNAYTPYQKAVLNDINATIEEMIDCGVNESIKIESLVIAHEKVRPEFRLVYLARRARAQTRIMTSGTTQAARSRSRSPTRDTTASNYRNREEAPSSQVDSRVKAHEELRAALRKYKIDLETVEADGETVPEVLRQTKRAEDGRTGRDGA